MLEKKIEILSSYFDGIIPLKDGYKSVRIVIPSSWNTYEKKIGELSIHPVVEAKVSGTNDVKLALVGEPGIDLGEIMDFAHQLILHNLEKESKNVLFNKKIDELRVLFNENNLSKLERLSFKFESTSNKKKKIINATIDNSNGDAKN